MNRKIVAHHQLTVREYDDGEVVTQWQRLDPATRRLTSESLLNFQQSGKTPYTAEELAMIAAAERVARSLYTQNELF